MKMTHAFTATMILGGIGLAAFAPAQSKFSLAATTAGNEQEFGYNSGNTSLNANYSGTGSAVTASTNKNFSGFDSWGDPQTMNINSTSFATAEFGILKSSASATITNPFYSSDNPWYWNPGTSQIQTNGVPDFFLIAGTSSYSDVFTYTGLGAGFTVNFFYHVDGTLTGDTAYNTLWVTNNGVTEYFDVEADENGNVDQVFVTHKYAPNANSQISHTTSLTSGISARLYELDEGVNIVAESNFANTVSLVGMVAYDASGNVASGWSFTAGSGATYPVPEPTTMVILGIGALAALKRRKN